MHVLPRLTAHSFLLCRMEDPESSKTTMEDPESPLLGFHPRRSSVVILSCAVIVVLLLTIPYLDGRAASAVTLKDLREDYPSAFEPFDVKQQSPPDDRQETPLAFFEPQLACPYNPEKIVSSKNFTGGFGDRIKGLVNLFVIALLANRTMVVHPNIFPGAEDYFKEGGCRWVGTWDAVEGLSVWEQSVIDVRTDRFYEVDFAAHFDDRVWDFVSNMPITDEVIMNPAFKSSAMQPVLLRLHQRGTLFHTCLRMLLRPSPRLRDVTASIFARFGPEDSHYLIGIHLRSGDDGGKVNTTRAREKRSDDYRFTHPHALRMAPDESFGCFAQEAISKWYELPATEQQKHPRGPLFFLSGDHQRARDIITLTLADAGFPSFDLGPGEAVHLEQAGDQSRTYLDWWFLTQCRQLVITVSGFSEIASKWNCSPVSFFINHPSLKKYYNFGDAECQYHFIRMRGSGLCVPEADDNPLYEYSFERYT